MKLYTSNFAKSARDPMAVAICQGVPKWYTGRRYLDLAPSRALVKGGYIPEVFRKLYMTQCLLKLNPHLVLKELGEGAIMLCWEAAEDFCHRQIVADWLRKETGATILEVPAKEKKLQEVEQLSVF